MPALPKDLSYAFRNLRRSPVFTVVALASLALGIGANTAIFGLMDQVMLRLLPVKDPQQMVLLGRSGPNFGRVNGSNTYSYPMYKEIRDRNQVFAGVIARYNTPLAMSFKGSTERVNADLVSGNFFDVLGVNAVRGRLLTPEDDKIKSGHPVAVLSHGYWTRRFGSDPSIVNQTIRLNGKPMTVIGITPSRFQGIEVGNQPDVFVPVMMKPDMTPGWDDLENKRSMWLAIAARLKPEISPTQADAAMAPLMRSLLEQELSEIPGMPAAFQKRFLTSKITVLPGARGASDLRQQFSKPLLVLMSMVGLVLLIACANVANLLIARAASRQKEIAIRLALGAGRRHIFRQLIVESLVLSLGGGILGVLVSTWTGSALIHFLPQETAVRSLSADPDLRVLLFALGLSILTGLLFGLVPAWQATRPAMAGTLKDQSSSVSPGKAQVRFRLALVSAQVALSLLLLIGAGLFATSLYHLRSLNPGFRTENILSFAVDPQLNGYSQPRVREFYSSLRKGVASIPGVRSVTFADSPVLEDWIAMMTIDVEGYQRKEGEDMNPQFNWISPQYFDTLGIAMTAGRDFNDRDIAGSPRVVIVNEALVKQFFPNQNPLGRHIYYGGRMRDRKALEIVGVVKESKHNNLRDKPTRVVYVPYEHGDNLGRLSAYVQADGDPTRIAGAVRREVARLDADLPVFDLRTLEQALDNSIFLDRIIAALSSAFGLLATLLATVGLYGVMAYTVARRTRELGVRIALGAARGDILWLVMREVSVLIGIGIAIALPAAHALGRLIESQLYGIKADDPWVFGGATFALASVALLAGLVPAMRAARVDPLIALRYE